MERILTRHKLKHIPELKVGQNIFDLKFSKSCSPPACSGACCKYGVFADIKERELILANRELVVGQMEPHQERDHREWFEHYEICDRDFPSGRAVGTQFRDYGCVFLDSANLCALQKASAAAGMDPYGLKPFYCVAFPVTIDNGVLKIDDTPPEDRMPCLIIDETGELDVFDVCANELEYMLGGEGAGELKKMAGKFK